MFTMSLFDVTGIQHYIFQSNRLKENIGASTLVEMALSTYLKEAMQDVLARYVIDWENADRFALLHDCSQEAEVIYIGGGNAMVAFRDRDTARKVTHRLSRILLERAPSLNMTVVHKDVCGQDFVEDRRSLFEDIQQKKAETFPIRLFGGISITELCPDTFQPVCHYDEYGDPMSVESQKKRQALWTKELTYTVQSERFVIPSEFDDLGRRDGESYIGIVHIDGNSSGYRLNQLLADVQSYEDAVQKIRQFSKEMDQTYKQAFQYVIDKLQKCVVDEKIKQIQLKKVEEEGIELPRYYLPIRDIVLNGDDVTFVCDGRLALSLSYLFLSYLGKQTLSVDNQPCTACAGIAIVKPHFPFFRAYQIAEQCCASAKKRAKEEAQITGRAGCWLDFHVVASGIRDVELQDARKKHYRITDGDNSEDKYHLLWRPWLVSERDRMNKYLFGHFIRIYHSFIEGNDAWPRNKLKQLKNAFASGKQATALYLREVQSRGLCLPDFQPVNITDGFSPFDQTPYYDVLEMLDLFTMLPENQEANHAN